MANIAIWPGSSSFFPGMTPFGYYDYDYSFQQDVDKVADWCAKRLGYPIMEVELQDINFYAAIEEAITEFGTQINMYNAKDYMLTLVGTPTSSILTNNVITPNMGRTISLAHNYGNEVGSGGDVDWKKGYITMTASVQTYDLDAWAAINEPGKSIEIKRVYHDFAPAIVRYFDPYVGTGAGTQQLLDGFGWGSYSPAVSFLVMPLYADLLRIQAIEMNDQIRKSSYSFELRNNNLTLFPIPSFNGLNMWFEYLVVEDRNNPIKANASGKVTDLSNVPFSNLTYEYVNPLGKQWIYKYALAVAKEMLGLVRGKYASIPIPGAETTLNGADLIAQGREDKQNLLTELKELLQGLSRQGQFEQEQAVATAMNYQLGKVPLPIYIK